MAEFEFFDTNILLYAKIDDESSPKHAIASDWNIKSNTASRA